MDVRPPDVPGVTGLAPIGSAVYRGHHVATGRSVAVKIVATRLDRAQRIRFEREQERIARLAADRTILPVDEIGTSADGRTYLITELCAESLADRVLRYGPLPSAAVASLGRQLASTLYRLHALGVVHGAVTPHNLLFRATGDAVLGDAGAAARVGGDPYDPRPFAAPETLRTGANSAASDLYGLGVTLYFAASGHPPFPVRIDEYPSEWVRRVIDEPAPLADIWFRGPELATLLGDLLATDPEDRPGDAADVAARLAGLTELAQPAEPAQQTEPAQSRAATAEDCGTDWSRLLDEVLSGASSAEVRSSPLEQPREDRRLDRSANEVSMHGRTNATRPGSAKVPLLDPGALKPRAQIRQSRRAGLWSRGQRRG